MLGYFWIKEPLEGVMSEVNCSGYLWTWYYWLHTICNIDPCKLEAWSVSHVWGSLPFELNVPWHWIAEDMLCSSILLFVWPDRVLKCRIQAFVWILSYRLSCKIFSVFKINLHTDCSLRWNSLDYGPFLKKPCK